MGDHSRGLFGFGLFACFGFVSVMMFGIGAPRLEKMLAVGLCAAGALMMLAGQ